MKLEYILLNTYLYLFLQSVIIISMIPFNNNRDMLGKGEYGRCEINGR